MKFLIKLVTLIFAIVAVIAVLFVVVTAAEKALLPQDYYFYQYHPLAEAAMIYLLVVPVVTFFAVLHGRFRGKRVEALEDMYELFFVWRRLGKGRFLFIFAWLICLYCCITSATVVTEDKIICHSPLHPSGTVYDYQDVSQIKAAFGQKRFSFLEYQKKGNFYYQIEVGGKKKVFYTPSVNDEIQRYADETYLELEDFDRKLASLNVSKQSSEKGWKACDLDREYVDRFLRIIKFGRNNNGTE